MAIRIRQKRNSDIEEVGDLNSSTSTSNDKKLSSIEEEKILRSFKEEAIRTLNILEKSGIDIYDENRTPGMYVKRRLEKYYGKNLVNAPAELIKLLTKNTEEVEEETISDDIRLKLLKAFKR